MLIDRGEAISLDHTYIMLSEDRVSLYVPALTGIP